MRKAHLQAAIIVAAILAWTAASSAAPQQLNCTLTDTAGQLASATRPIVVSFDADAKTLKAQDGNQSYNFANVSISNVAISGDTGNASVGIDRSSLGVVWQQYGAGKASIQFGQCQPSASSAAAATR